MTSNNIYAPLGLSKDYTSERAINIPYDATNQQLVDACKAIEAKIQFPEEIVEEAVAVEEEDVVELIEEVEEEEEEQIIEPNNKFEAIGWRTLVG